MAFYWYQSDPDLYRAEVQAMNKFFPSLTIHQLPVWDLMLIYKNDHPHAGASEYGGSIQILPVQPRLKDIATRMMPILEETYGSYENCVRHGFGLGLPHIYRDNFGRNEEYFICTADPKYFKTGMTRSTSAASSLSWACKWILLCEMWMNGEISDDVALEGNY